MHALRSARIAAIFFVVLLGSTAAEERSHGGQTLTNPWPGGGGAIFPGGLAVDPAGNGVLEPNETAVMAPTWVNTFWWTIPATGTTSGFTGPAGPLYEIPDAAANYGNMVDHTYVSCLSTGDCYSVRATAATRPLTHWDSTIHEIVTDGLNSFGQTWTLHIGASFADVPTSSPFYKFVETILHRQVTGGCTATTYCPTASTTREQMAVFALVSKQGTGYNPVACVAGAEMFSDVPASSPFCKWVEELARRGVVGGCTATTYCPGAAATREQMAVFVLRTLNPALSPPACTTPMFADVPASSPFCPWIEELVRRRVVSGCGGGNYCPAADVSREQMGVFLTVTFGLTLYGL
jgi:S-layer family protein